MLQKFEYTPWRTVVFTCEVDLDVLKLFDKVAVKYRREDSSEGPAVVETFHCLSVQQNKKGRYIQLPHRYQKVYFEVNDGFNKRYPTRWIPVAGGKEDE